MPINLELSILSRMSSVSPPFLASCGGDDVCLWSIAGATHKERSYTPITTFAPHSKTGVGSLVWNHNDQVIITGGGDGVVALSHVSGQLLGTLGASNNPAAIRSVCLSGGSRYLGTGGINGIPVVWDLKKKEVIKTMTGHPTPVSCVAFSPSDSHIASSSVGGDVWLHSMLTGGMVSSYRPDGGDNGVSSIVFSPFKKQNIAVACADGSVHVWDSAASTTVASFDGHDEGNPCTSVIFSPANKLLLCSGGDDGRLNFYDVADRRVVRSMTMAAPITSLSFLHDGITLGVGTSNGHILIYDLRAGQTPSYTLSAHSRNPGGVRHIMFHHGKGGPVSSTATTAATATTGSISAGTTSSTAPTAAVAPTSLARTAVSPPGDLSSRYPSVNEIQDQVQVKISSGGDKIVGPSDKSSNYSNNKVPVAAPVRETLGSAYASAVKQLRQENEKHVDKDKDTSVSEEQIMTVVEKDKSPIREKDARPVTASRRTPPRVIPYGRNEGEDSGASVRERERPGSSDFEQKYLRSLVSDSMASLQQSLRQDIQNLHLDMLRQFYQQQQDVAKTIEDQAGKMTALMEEVENLRRENRELKQMY